LTAGYFASRWITGFLFDVSPRDLTTFAVVPCVLAAVALLACYLPARRATRVDAVVALRES
jgi:ABC-type lipoprotein release transport system permease subunit